MLWYGAVALFIMGITLSSMWDGSSGFETTILASEISESETVIPVYDGRGFYVPKGSNDPGVVSIGDEIIEYWDIIGPTEYIFGGTSRRSTEFGKFMSPHGSFGRGSGWLAHFSTVNEASAAAKKERDRWVKEGLSAGFKTANKRLRSTLPDGHRGGIDGYFQKSVTDNSLQYTSGVCNGQIVGIPCHEGDSRYKLYKEWKDDRRCDKTKFTDKTDASGTLIGTTKSLGNRCLVAKIGEKSGRGAQGSSMSAHGRGRAVQTLYTYGIESLISFEIGETDGISGKFKYVLFSANVLTTFLPQAVRWDFDYLDNSVGTILKFALLYPLSFVMIIGLIRIFADLLQILRSLLPF